MADEITTTLTTTQIGDSFKATPEQVQGQCTALTEQVLKDLVSGTSPLSSKTIIANIGVIVLGIAGVFYTFYTSGDIGNMLPFLATTGVGVLNCVLRFLTTGPLIPNALNKLIDAYASATPQKVQ